MNIENNMRNIFGHAFFAVAITKHVIVMGQIPLKKITPGHGQ